MALFRSISMSFWTDTKVADDFTPEDKYFMLYCLTNPYTNLCGCYEISIKQISRDTGYNEETVKRLIDRLQEVHKVIQYDYDTKELFISNWYKHNWTKSEKLDKPLLNEIKKVKSIDFKEFLVDLYNKRDTVSIPYTYRIDTTNTNTNTNILNNNNNILNINNNNNKTKKEKPTLEEIEQYVKEKGYDVDAKYFFDYYEAGNWHDGSGKPVKSWKQKLITWSKHSTPKQEPKLEIKERDLDGPMLSHLSNDEIQEWSFSKDAQLRMIKEGKVIITYKGKPIPVEEALRIYKGE